MAALEQLDPRLAAWSHSTSQLAGQLFAATQQAVPDKTLAVQVRLLRRSIWGAHPVSGARPFVVHHGARSAGSRVAPLQQALFAPGESGATADWISAVR